ncbi:uncharacterized protein N7515_000689 [Penicillium bovifimosum]|uniref:Uncharacterized protein n=1 Tax=Penicillium bovifimosum TaxID=126998 RepID=A0A9W9LBN5_9EURO|nr:uncharacterized protein N7515_000689 [Penicillium bovifimosum]KAJ5146125.1 hypothetical protein N7515_000689 [Penicillium bovifimosum]
MPGSYPLDTLDEVVEAPAATELAPTRSKPTSSISTGEGPIKPPASRPAREEPDWSWLIVDRPTHGSLRTGTRSHLDVLLAQREERRRAESALISSLGGLQVTAAS